MGAFYPIRVNHTDLAVILVDMQSGFVKDLRPKEAKLIISRQKEVIRACACNDIPVIALEYAGLAKLGRTIDELQQEISLVPRHLYLLKGDDDGFVESDLWYVLEELGTEHLLIMGVNLSACVKKTARSADKLGFGVFVARDLMADRPAKRPYRPELKTSKNLAWYRRNTYFEESVYLHEPALKLGLTVAAP